MQGELIRIYARGVVFKYLASRPRDDFAAAFNRANRLCLHWPISINYWQEDDLFEVQDADGRSIFLVHVELGLLARFKDGVDARLNALAAEYMVQSVRLAPESVVIDVGANIGEFSKLVVERYGARVIAVEPEIREYRCLLRNADSARCVAVNTALWKEPGMLTLYHKSATSDTSLIEPPDYDSTTTVEVRPLDQLEDLADLEEIHLIKLEAEGAEPEILDGASETLRRTRFVSVDCGPERGLSQEDVVVPVIGRLKAAGYSIIGYFAKRSVLLFSNDQIRN